MKRPWQVWLVFAVCVLGAAGAMVWLTREATDADRSRRAAEAEAQLEQRVSLALWRMDTELAPIIAEEVIRPPGDFRRKAFKVEPPANVSLQFEAGSQGAWMSPQRPSGDANEPAPLAELRQLTTYQHLLPQLPDAPLPSVVDVANQQGVNALPPNVAANTPNQVALDGPPAQLPAEEEDQFPFYAGNRANESFQQTKQSTGDQQQQAAQPTAQAANSSGSKIADFQQRGKRYQTAAEQSLRNYVQREAPNQAPVDEQPAQSKPTQLPVASKVATKAAAPEPLDQVGVSRPIWVSGNLVLARRVVHRGETVVQGSVLNWPLLKERLLGEARDLLPKADLVPVNGDAADDPSRMLAGLPVRLVVNESVPAVSIGPTLRWALWMGWGAVLLTVLAAAALLQGVMALSERRAAFVSSVTHELRTPLTTFRMYAEMLAKGMVPDAERRQEYYETLQKESERLTLLVENVLSYARLERGRRPQAQDRVTVVELLNRVRSRLEQRARQAGMECVVELNKKTASQAFTTDMAVVEQILFNLVDNAAKYARSASDLRIHVEANHQGPYVSFIVRDHGPGIGNGAAERSQPFEKSAQESAESAPGVGLGLALCRRLARELGGRLEVASANGAGAEVTLLLPAG